MTMLIWLLIFVIVISTGFILKSLEDLYKEVEIIADHLYDISAYYLNVDHLTKKIEELEKGTKIEK